jgi:hypothetical protein
MKKFFMLFTIGLLSLSCKGQENETKKNKKEENSTNLVEKPKGTWQVDKEFDENGNLIRYDSIYSWSSNGQYDNLSSFDRASLLQSIKSRFYKNFSRFENEGFEAVFSQDYLI